MTSYDIANKRCQPCKSGTPPLNVTTCLALLEKLPDWLLQENKLEKSFAFKNYAETMAFVNALAWISLREDHHPDLIVGYNRCRVSYWTHDVNGLSENDFICAAKVERLLEI
ncbi:MAG: 4a-hydroxytetrahydrobiopterin dehydratase [Azonexus sp.]|nr:4a-hydroxytetrahydrobiopterin dehydratase [Azonexus sp.]